MGVRKSQRGALREENVGVLGEWYVVDASIPKTVQRESGQVSIIPSVKSHRSRENRQYVIVEH
jgi:hypothetical protein